jgi:hypothetical protein
MVDELREMEREIEVTRARLKANIGAIGSDYTMDNLKATIKAEVVEAKDSALEFAKTSGAQMAREGFETLKRKAAANPAAALMIGAGVGWRLWKNPPIAAALAGVGLFSLFSSRENDPIRSATEYVREAVEDTASATVETVSRATQDLQNKVGMIAESATDHVQELLRSKVQSSGQMSDPSGIQRQILLSLAGAAVATAIGITVHRFRSDPG